jgi:tetratricopeptide (TPR) repeat protein
VSAGQSQSLAEAGWALLRVGNSRGAIRQFEAALAADPANTDAMAGMAQSHLNLGQLRQAEDLIEAMLAIGPNEAVAHRLNAEILRREKESWRAVSSAREAIRLDSREPLGYHILALCLSGQKKHKDAIKVCDEGLGVAPSSAILLAQRADNILQLKGGIAAKEDILAAVKLAPDSPYVLRVAARVALARNNPSRARDFLSTLLRRNANDREAVALYVMAEPRRHRIVRGLYVFRFWCKDHGALGVAVAVGAWGVFLIVAFTLALVTNVGGLILCLGARYFLKTQHEARAKEVQAHFAKTTLSADF